MKNRAKCRLCNSVIESFTILDYVSCKCGEISISGGNTRYECYAKDFSNFLRVDEIGNEIVVKVKEGEIRSENVADPTNFPSENVVSKKEDLLKMLDETIKNIESLPSNAMTLPINHYDFCSALILLSAILRSD